jgi:hypothetical protein
MQLEGLGQSENPFTTSGIETATFRFCSIFAQQIALLRVPILKIHN